MRDIFDCRACVERASDLIDGTLGPVARLISRAHILGCKDCREHVRQLETTIGVVEQATPAPTLDAEKKRALMEALRAKK